MREHLFLISFKGLYCSPKHSRHSHAFPIKCIYCKLNYTPISRLLSICFLPLLSLKVAHIKRLRAWLWTERSEKSFKTEINKKNCLTERLRSQQKSPLILCCNHCGKLIPMRSLIKRISWSCCTGSYCILQPLTCWFSQNLVQGWSTGQETDIHFGADPFNRIKTAFLLH